MSCSMMAVDITLGVRSKPALREQLFEAGPTALPADAQLRRLSRRPALHHG